MPGLAHDPPLVVVADDEPDILRLVERRLARRGYEVRTAVDGEAALALIRELDPSAAVLDCSMPGLEGPDVCRELRGAEASATLPVVLVSARAGGSERDLGLAAGADAYLTKPFDIDELDGVLRRLIAERG